MSRISGTPRDAPDGWIKDLALSYVSATSVSVGVGLCRDSTDLVNIDVTGTLTIAITSSGANGLDTGSEAADTWYAVFVIDDSTRANSPAGLLSVSDSSPTLPSGYDVFRRVGWARNDGSSDFLEFNQRGNGSTRRCWYDELIVNVRVLNAGNAISFTDIDLSNFVPSTSENVVFRLEFETGSSGSAGNQLRLRPNGSTKATSVFTFRVGIVSSVEGFTQMEMPCDSSQLIEYKVNSTNNSAYVYVAGFDDEV